MFQTRVWLLVLIICFAAAMRLVDHPWNLAPVGALSLFAGVYFRDRSSALIVPLCVMFLSDVAIGVLRHNTAFYTFHALVPFVYGCYVLNVCLGFGVRRYWNRLPSRPVPTAGEADNSNPSGRVHHIQGLARKLLPVPAATLAGSLLFFLVTNFAVWAMFPTYPHTWAGLLTCYERGIPFFRTTLFGDVFYVTVFFGGYELIKNRLPLLQKSGLLQAQ